MELFDSHAHYDDSAFDADRDELLRSLPASGVTCVINAGISLASSRQSAELSEKYPFLYAAAGIHPEEADGEKAGDLEAITELARTVKKVVAIGEIGLDYHYEGFDRQRQLDLFDRQLIAANRLGLPIIVHDRDAHADTLALLRRHRPRGVLHCFSGSAEMAKEVTALGFYLGFTGSVTFKNNKKAAAVLSVTPRDRILIETDCPYMAPEPLRGNRCDSSMLRHTVSVVADRIGLTAEETAELTARNARELFGLGSR